MEIGLNDIKPQDTEVIIDNESYTLRKFNLEDEAWLNDTFKGQNVFGEQMTKEQLCRIAFHQLSYEDKKRFAPVDVKIINDDTGEETTKRIGGWRLFRLKVTSSPQEQLDLFKAVLHTVGISRPMLDKILSEDEKDLLSNPNNVKKKKRTGHK